MEAGVVDLVGRDGELAAIEAFLDAVHELPGTLLLEGEAGIGKTSLCTSAVAAGRARGYETLVTRPAAAEAPLALTGIGDLLEPVLERVLAALPPPQARALRVAMLLEEQAEEPDARALGLAFRSALRILAAETPVLVVVDDVQWLDASSQHVVRFATRRLREERLAFIFARRAGHADAVLPGLDGVRRLEIGGLSLGALHRLLHRRLDLLLPRPALRRLHELSGGNPFYALELGRAYVAGAIRLEHGDPLPPPTVETLVGDRIAALPERTRMALAAAAARPHAVVPLTGPPDVFLPAVDAGVVVLHDGGVRFTHPLLAAAAYSALGSERRRNLHSRLARQVADPEERARHLALATVAPDEPVALELELAARRARLRGAVAAAAELAERALALTPLGEGEARDRRTLAAARLRFESGDVSTPRQLLESLIASPRESARAEAKADLARIYMFEGTRRRAVALLRSAEETDDPGVRAIVNQRLTGTLVLLRQDLRWALGQTRAALERAERGGDPAVLTRALAAHGFVGGMVGDPEAVAILERGAALERHVGEVPRLERPSYNLAGALMWTDELDRAREMFASLYRDAAEREDEVSLAWTAANLANVEFLAGRWDAALRWADEGDAVAQQTQQTAQQAGVLVTKALVHAHRGEAEPARATAAQALELSGDEVAIVWMNARWALGVLELSLGDPEAAHEQLAPACDHVEREGMGEPGTTRFLFDDVEALVALGRIGEARRRLDRVEGHARRLDRAFARAVAGRCRALLALREGNRPEALRALELALEQHARKPWAFERARTLVVQGTALRLEKRKREARAALEQARRDFDELGAALFKRRAEDELTASERQVADLVAQGLRNREVASALFVTPKTVEFHLRNVFRKLGIRSRAELARRHTPES